MIILLKSVQRSLNEIKDQCHIDTSHFFDKMQDWISLIEEGIHKVSTSYNSIERKLMRLSIPKNEELTQKQHCFLIIPC